MLRNELTISEARLWGGIKNGATGARFRRQVPIGVWIVDFVSLRPKLVVEVDDTSHHWRHEIDRTEHLESLGYTILRFDNEDIAKDIDLVIGTIGHWVNALRTTGLPPE